MTPRIAPALLAALIALVDAALAWLGAPLWATIPSGLCMVVLLPGYAWWCAFRPKTDSPPLRDLLMVVMASLGIVIVTGLALNALPEGLTKRTWALALFAIVELGLLVALSRGSFRTVTELDEAAKRTRGTVRVAPRSTAFPRRATLAKSLAALGCVVAAGAISLSSQHAATASEHFTSLGLSGIRTKSPAATVVNHQGRTTSYELAVSVGGQTIAGERIAVASGAKVTEDLRRYLTTTPRHALVKVTLSLVGSPTPYRDVWFETTA